MILAGNEFPWRWKKLLKKIAYLIKISDMESGLCLI